MISARVSPSSNLSPNELASPRPNCGRCFPRSRSLRGQRLTFSPNNHMHLGSKKRRSLFLVAMLFAAGGLHVGPQNPGDRVRTDQPWRLIPGRPCRLRSDERRAQRAASDSHAREIRLSRGRHRRRARKLPAACHVLTPRARGTRIFSGRFTVGEPSVPYRQIIVIDLKIHSLLELAP